MSKETFLHKASVLNIKIENHKPIKFKFSFIKDETKRAFKLDI